MSGHSKWSTIKRAKGVADIKKGQTFTKVAMAISIAAKAGNSGNPDDNPRLRQVLEEAKSVNMPKENVQRAIDRGLGKLPGQTIEEVIYEGYGPSKTAFLIEVATDNKLRTLQVIKNLFDRAGGSLGGSGSVRFMFDIKGEIKVASKQGSKDDELLELIDLGAEDVEELLEDNLQKYLVYTIGSELNTMGTKITQAGYTIETKEIISKPNVVVEIKDLESAKKVLDFANKIEELDDVQKVFANFDISEDLDTSLL